MLQDFLNRKITYARISLTQKCNFSCEYCLPNGWNKSENNELSLNEIDNLLAVLKQLGIQKIRLTGGEPSLYQNLNKVIELVRKKYKFANCSLTTNGYNLAKQAQLWQQAGLNSINVSIDSLDSNKFAQITKVDILDKVLKGIDHALSLNMEVKINSVLLKDINASHINEFISFAHQKDITVRFIELMQNEICDKNYLKKRQILASDIITKLKQQNWYLQPPDNKQILGPATIYKHDEKKGKIGFITPYSKDFCLNCNRIRFTSQGELLLCLFGKRKISLKHLLIPDTQQLLLAKLVELISSKPKSHHLTEQYSGACGGLSTIGG